MSRSFPCTPLGYVRNWANVQNLVELAKIERDIADPKKTLLAPKGKKKTKGKKYMHEKSPKNSVEQRLLSPKIIQVDSEQREKSDLTQEHDQRKTLCYMSDESQGNNKRKRQDLSDATNNVKVVAGKPLRIRIVLRNPKEPKSVPHGECISSSQDDNLPSTSQADEIDTIEHKQSKESRCNPVFPEWVPSLSSYDDDDDDEDQDWLFGRSKQENSMTKKVENIAILGDPAWPKALVYSEVGIYPLPYTILF